ncbi:hypothetical protein DICVIV_01223 [Dictyocaulus viviparus]|uniref:Transmembrane 9 superfamily member n=1 Tax=Dictyocaulus viviparus TaxID=29172 RepID=A0A0D8Y6M1_DICVI|nr:hypothetical protein DICVIV_01223 [Dictyocaulus viviparus]
MVTQFYSIIIYFGLILFEQRLHVAGEDKVIGYRSGDAIAVQTYRLSNNVPSASYDYYTLPFCRPDEDFLDQAKNLQRILGKGLVSPYQLYMKNDTICSSTCEDNEPAVVKASKAKLLMNLIEKNYTFNFMADGILPRRRHTDPNTGEVSYPYEIWMGWVENDGKVFLNNHLDMELIYEENSQGLYRIVEFIINPRSVKSITFDQQSEECTGISNAADPYELKAEDQKIYWTYSVTWKRSNLSHKRVRKNINAITFRFRLQKALVQVLLNFSTHPKRRKS